MYRAKRVISLILALALVFSYVDVTPLSVYGVEFGDYDSSSIADLSDQPSDGDGNEAVDIEIQDDGSILDVDGSMTDDQDIENVEEPDEVVIEAVPDGSSDSDTGSVEEATEPEEATDPEEPDGSESEAELADTEDASTGDESEPEIPFLRLLKGGLRTQSAHNWADSVEYEIINYDSSSNPVSNVASNGKPVYAAWDTSTSPCTLAFFQDDSLTPGTLEQVTMDVAISRHKDYGRTAADGEQEWTVVFEPEDGATFAPDSLSFAYCAKLTNVDFDGLDTSNVTDMSSLFSGCKSLQSMDLSSLDTSNVTKMNSMFGFCNVLQSVDFGNIDTSNVTDMTSMFYDCQNITSIDMSGLDTSNVTKMEYMFSNCYELESLDLSGIETDSVTTMERMFSGSNKLTTLNLSGWDTSNVTTMADMFSGCRALTTVDVSSFDTGNVTSMTSMFQNCQALTSVDVSDFDLSSVTDMGLMFQNCKSLTSLDVSDWDMSNVVRIWSIFSDCSSLTAIDVSNWNLRSANECDTMFQGCKSLTELDLSSWEIANGARMSNLTKGSESIERIVLGESFKKLKNGNAYCSGSTFIDEGILWENENTGDVYSSRQLISAFDGSPEMVGAYINVTPRAMLYEDGTLIFQNDSDLAAGHGDLYGTYLIKNQSGWFPGWTSDHTARNKIKSVEFESGFTYAGSTKAWFSECSFLTSFDASNFDTSNVTDMEEMFNGCLNLTSLDLSSWDTSNVTNMRSMFDGCRNLADLDLSGWDTSSLTRTDMMFYNCSSLTELDVENWDMSDVTKTSSMFNRCSALTSLDLSNWDVSNVTEMYSMFNGCTALTSLDLSDWNTGNVTDMSYLFQNCSSLASLDVSGFDTGRVNNMGCMFSGCNGLTSLNVSGFDTSNVTNMYSMFQDCNALASLDVSNFNTGKVYNTQRMFTGCFALTELDVSDWDTFNVTRMCEMFSSCRALTAVDVSGFDTGKVTDMNSLFLNCQSLTELDLNGWDTSKVTNMGSMFSGCNNLRSLDLSTFDMGIVTSAGGMFSNDNNLEKVVVSEDFRQMGKSGTSNYNANTLPAGKWYLVEKFNTPDELAYTAEEFYDNWDGATMAGTWTKEKEVLFNANGGNASFAKKSVIAGVAIGELPTATKKGFTFDGWHTAPTGGTRVTAETEANQNVYYAHWTPITYTLAFEANGGTGAIPSETLEYNEGYTLTAGNLAREGYRLVGFNTRSNGRGYSYSINDTVSKLSATDGATVTLYAEWEVNGYVITFDSTGGSPIPDRQVRSGESLGSLYTPARDGYTFMGWYTAAEGGSSVTSSTRPTGDTTYYAHWMANPTATFDTNGGDTATSTKEYNYNAALGALPASSKENSVFKGWYTAPTGGYQVSSSTRITSDTTYYAQYGVQLLFNPNGGRIVTPADSDGVEIQNPSSYTVESLAVAEKDGYTFDGWYTALDGGSEVHVGDTLDLTVDNSVYAHWTPNERVTLTYNANGGRFSDNTSTASVDYYAGQTIGAFLDAANGGNGKTPFLGWYTAAEGGDQVTVDTVISDDMTVYAHWGDAGYVTVYFHRNGGGNVCGRSWESGTYFGANYTDYRQYTYSMSTGPDGKIQSLPGAYYANHVLEGWYPNADGTGEKLTTDTVITGPTLYYAKWIDSRVEESGGAVDYIYDASWTNSSNEYVDNVNDRLHWHLKSSTYSVSATMHVMFELNQAVDTILPEGAVKIQIPKSVWKDWDGNWTGSNNLSQNIPQYPNKRNGMFFSYIDEDDHYTLINNTPLSGGAGVDVVITYTANPTNIPGGAMNVTTGQYIDGYDYYDNTLPITYTVDTDGDNVADITKTKNLDIEMHTALTGSRSKYFSRVAYSWDNSWGSKPADAEDNFYVVWSLSEYLSGSQPGTYEWSEDTAHDGTVVYMQNSTVVTKHPLSLLTAPEATTTGIVVKNDAYVTETWKSGYKETHRTSAQTTIHSARYPEGSWTKRRTTWPSGSYQINGGQEDILDDKKEVNLSYVVEFDGGGDTAPTWDDATGTYTAQERTFEFEDGVHGDVLYSSGAATEKFNWVPDTGDVMLGDNDYRIHGLSINITEYDATNSDGVWSEPNVHSATTDYDYVEVWIRTKGSNDFYLFDRRTGTGSYTLILPTDAVGYRLKHRSNFYSTHVGVTADLRLKPTGNVQNLIRDDVNLGVTSIIKNIARCTITDDSGNVIATYTNRGTDGSSALKEAYELNVSKTTLYATKEAPTSTITSDAVNGVQTASLRITGYNYNNSYRTKRIKSGVFYDLLPMGTSVDENSIVGYYVASGNSYGNKTMEKSYYNVSFISNWEDSGRTMMIINVALPENVTSSKVYFDYQLKNTYENIVERGTVVKTEVVFANTTPDRTPYVGYNQPVNTQAFYQNVKNQNADVAYATRNVTYKPVDAYSWGYSKFVMTRASYEAVDETLPNNEYTYKLTYSQSELAKSDRIVFYDVLEGGTDTNSSEWYGTLKSVNVESIKDAISQGNSSLHCDPVVYYSTKARSDFTDSDYDVTNASVWTSTKPADLATVTAIAVDCSKATDGSDFILTNKGAMTVYITMQAPDDVEYIGKSTTNQGISYARKAQQGELVGDATPEYADATVTIRDTDVEITKSSDPETGSSLLPHRVEFEDDINYTLSVTNNDTDFTVHNVLVTDTIPTGLTPDWDNVTVYMNDQNNAINITLSPRVDFTTNGQRVMFDVKELLPGETLRIRIPTMVNSFRARFENTAEIISVNGMAKSISSDTMYHEIKPTPVTIKKLLFGKTSRVAGARLQVRSASGRIVDTWTSEANADYVVEVSPGTYTLTELTPPTGYLAADPITFTVDSNGTVKIGEDTVTDITMYDKRDSHIYHFEKVWNTTEATNDIELGIIGAGELTAAEEKAIKAGKTVYVTAKKGSTKKRFLATADENGVVSVPAEYQDYEQFEFIVRKLTGLRLKRYKFTYTVSIEDPDKPATLTLHPSVNGMDASGNSVNTVILAEADNYEADYFFREDDVEFTETYPSGWHAPTDSTPAIDITPDGDDFNVVVTNEGAKMKVATETVEEVEGGEIVDVNKEWTSELTTIAFNVVSTQHGSGKVKSIAITSADKSETYETLSGEGALVSSKNYDPTITYNAHVTFADNTTRDIAVNPTPFVKPEVVVTFEDTDETKTVYLNAANEWHDTVELIDTSVAPSEVTIGDWTYTYEQDALTSAYTIHNTINREIPVVTVYTPDVPWIVQTGNNGLPNAIYPAFAASVAAALFLFFKKKRKHSQK